MATFTADTWQATMNLTDSDISNTNAEYIIDQGIDILSNLGQIDLPNMTGTTPGSKTWSGTQRQKGAIMEASRITYYGFYKELDTVSISGLSVTTADVLANPTIRAELEKLAQNLKEMDVSVG